MSEIIAYFSSPQTDAPLTRRELEDIHASLVDFRGLLLEDMPDPSKEPGMRNLEELIKRVYELSGGTGDAY